MIKQRKKIINYFIITFVMTFFGFFNLKWFLIEIIKSNWFINISFVYLLFFQMLSFFIFFWVNSFFICNLFWYLHNFKIRIFQLPLILIVKCKLLFIF